MIEKGAERAFLCLDNEYKKITKNDAPKKSKIFEIYPIR